MNALILGGCGFIGSHVADKLLDANCRVRVLDRAQEQFRTPLPGVEYRFADFGDVPSLAEALQGIDVVLHLISTTVPSTSNLDAVSDVEGNLLGTLRLLHLMAHQKVRKVVFLSSGGTVYGVPEQLPIPEEHPLRPICSYGVVKVAIENYLYMHHRLSGLEYVVLRPSNPYGERQGHFGVQGVIGTFLRKMRAAAPIEIWGDGEAVRDFIYVGDLASACAKAALGDVGGVFNIGAGKGCSINEVVGMLRQVTNVEPTVRYHAPRSYDVPRVVLNAERAAKSLGWHAKTGLAEGLTQTWAWLQTQP